LTLLENEMANWRGGLIAAWLIGVLLWIPVASAADSTANGSAGEAGTHGGVSVALPPAPQNPGATESGIRPGDESLTCEQIYAQGAADAQREQEERNATREQMRARSGATAALMTGAMLTGGLGGTGLAAQKAAEIQADRQMAELGRSQSNPRKEHLRQLWTQKHCVKGPQ
jgi:hypothetical protein